MASGDGWRVVRYNGELTYAGDEAWVPWTRPHDKEVKGLVPRQVYKGARISTSPSVKDNRIAESFCVDAILEEHYREGVEGDFVFLFVDSPDFYLGRWPFSSLIGYRRNAQQPYQYDVEAIGQRLKKDSSVEMFDVLLLILFLMLFQFQLGHAYGAWPSAVIIALGLLLGAAVLRVLYGAYSRHKVQKIIPAVVETIKHLFDGGKKINKG